APWPTGPQNTFVGFTRVAEKIKGDAANRDGVLRVRVEAPRRPTEPEEAVGTALRNLFPDLQIEFAEDRLTRTTQSLGRLRQRIRDQRIRDTARRQLLAGRRGDRTNVSLSKQAAFVGGVNFAAGSPLGDILAEREADGQTRVKDPVAERRGERKGQA